MKSLITFVINLILSCGWLVVFVQNIVQSGGNLINVIWLAVGLSVLMSIPVYIVMSYERKGDSDG